MKLLNNFEKLVAGGAEITTTVIGKSVKPSGCDDITKSRKREYHRKYHKKYYEEHKQDYLKRIAAYVIKNKELVKERQRHWYFRNKEYVLEQSARYKLLNRNKVRRRGKFYRQKNADKIRKYNIDNAEHIRNYKTLYVQRRCKSDPMFKLIFSCRKRIRGFLKCRGLKKNKKTVEILGCSPLNLKLYLESLFETGMTWKNHGIRGWHIDHIIPLASAKNESDVYDLCHYTNLQPLWWEENLKKKKSICYERV